jgi:hypothetical protein
MMCLAVGRLCSRNVLASGWGGSRSWGSDGAGVLRRDLCHLLGARGLDNELTTLAVEPHAAVAAKLHAKSLSAHSVACCRVTDPIAESGDCFLTVHWRGE